MKTWLEQHIYSINSHSTKYSYRIGWFVTLCLVFIVSPVFATARKLNLQCPLFAQVPPPDTVQSTVE